MSSYGLDIWHTGETPEFDIVFIHGLRGHREKTWERDGVVWPRDLLPHDVKNSRIMSFGYDSRITHSDTAEVTQGSLDNEAQSLCSLLVSERSTPDTENRPIIFVAHSLGGLVCAEIIVLGERNAVGDDVQAVSAHTKGMIFLGTPFGGSSSAKWGELVRRIFSLVQKTDKNTLKTLKEDSNELRQLRKEFQDLARKRNGSSAELRIVFFFETLDTHRVRIVEQDAASYPGVGETLPIRANHIGICKFASPDEDGYKVIKAKILQMMRRNDKSAEDKAGTVIFHNYDRVINQSARDIVIHSQTFQ